LFITALAVTVHNQLATTVFTKISTQISQFQLQIAVVHQ